MMRLKLGALFSSASSPLRSLRTIGVALTTVAAVAAPSFAEDETPKTEKRHYGSISTNALLVGNMTLAGSTGDYARGGMSTTGMSAASLTAVHDRMALCDDLDGPACRSVDSISAAITHIDSIEMNDHITRLELMLNSMRGHQNSLKVAREELLDAKGLVKSLQSVQRSLQERITLLNGQITELQTVDAKRRVMNDDLTYRNRMLIQERDNAIARVRELETAVMNIRSTLDERASETAMLSQQLNHRTTELKGTMDTLKELKADNESRISLYRGARQELEETKDQLSAQTQMSEAMDIKIAEYEKSIAALKLQLDEARAVIDQLRGELVQRDGYIAQLKMEIEAEKAAHLETSRTLQDQTVAYNQSETARVSLAEALSAKQVELDETIMACEVTRRDLEFTKADLNSTKRALEECQANATDLEAQIVELTAEIAGLRAALTTAEAEALGYVSKITELEAVLVERDQTIIALKSLIENVKDENKALKLALEAADAEKLQAFADRDAAVEAEAAITLQLDTAGQTIVYLEGELAKLRARVEALEAENQELRKFEYLAQGQEAKISYLEAENDDLRAKLEAALAELTVVRTDRDGAQADFSQQINLIMSERDTAVSSLDVIRLELDQSRALYEGRIKDLTKERKAQDKQMHELKDRIYILGNLEQDKNALERKVVSLTAEVEDLSGALADSQAAEAQASADAARLKIERDQALAEVDSLNLRIQDLLMQIDRQTELTQQQRKEIILLRREIAELRAKGSEIDIHVSLVEQLKQKHADLQVELENLKTAPVVEEAIEIVETPATEVTEDGDVHLYMMDRTTHHHDHGMEGCAVANCGSSPDQQQAEILAMSQVLADIIDELDAEDVASAPLPVVISKLVKENQAMKLTLVQAKEELQAAESKWIILKAQSQDQSDEIKALTLTIEALKAKIADMEAQASEASGEYITIINEHADKYGDLVVEFEGAKEEHASNMLVVVRERDDLSARLALIENENADLHASVNALRVALDAKDAEVAEKLAAENAALAEAQDRLFILMAQGEDQSAEIEALQLTIAGMEQTIAGLEAAADEEQGKTTILINQYMAELDALNEELEAQEKRYLILVQEAEDKVSTVMAEQDEAAQQGLIIIGDLERDRDQLLARIDALEKAEGDMTAAIFALRDELADKDAEIARLKELQGSSEATYIIQIEKAQSELDAAESALAQERRKSSDLELLILNLRGDGDEAKARIILLQQKIDELKSTYDMTLADLEAEIAALTAERDGLADQLAIVSVERDDFELVNRQLIERIRELEAALAALEAKRDADVIETQRNIQIYINERDALEADLEERENRILIFKQEAAAQEAAMSSMSEQINGLNLRIAEFEQAKAANAAKIKDLEDRRKSDIDRLNITIRDLRSDLEDAREDLEGREIVDSKLLAQIKILEGRLADKQDEIQALVDAKGEQRTIIVTQEAEIERLAAEIKRLEQALADYKVMLDQHHLEIARAVDAEKSAAADKDAEIKRLTVILNGSNGKTADLEKQLQSRLLVIRDLEKQLAGRDTQITTLNLMITDMQDQLQGQGSDFDVIKLALEAELAKILEELERVQQPKAADTEIEWLSNAITSLEAAIADLEDQQRKALGNASIQIDAMKAELAEKNQALANLTVKLKRVQGMEEANQSLLGQIKDMEAEIARLNVIISQKDGLIADLNGDVDRLATENDILKLDIKSLKSEIGRKDRLIAQLQAQIKALEEELAKADRSQSGVNSLNNRITLLINEKSALETELAALRKRLEKSERLLDQKVSDINRLEREKSSLMAKMSDYELKIREIDALKQTVAKLRAEIADLSFQLSQKQTDNLNIDFLKARLAEAQKKIQELQEALTKAEQEARKMNFGTVPLSQFQALKRDFQELQLELQSCGSNLAGCVTQLDRARETMLIQEERIAELQYKLMNIPKPQAVIDCANGTKVLDNGSGNPCAETSKLFDLIAMRDSFHGDLAERLGTKQSFGSNFSAAIDFEPASPVIAASEEEDLDAIADAIKALGASEVGDRAWFVRVEGHADTDKISGAICYPRASLGQDTCIANNRELSMERAYNVVRALIERGVEEQRLSLSGFSDAHPISYVRGSNANGLSDRRIEFTLDLWR